MSTDTKVYKRSHQSRRMQLEKERLCAKFWKKLDQQKASTSPAPPPTQTAAAQATAAGATAAAARGAPLIPTKRKHLPSPAQTSATTSHQRINREEPVPVQQQHFPPSTSAAATAAATEQKRWEAGGRGGRATSKDKDACFRCMRKHDLWRQDSKHKTYAVLCFLSELLHDVDVLIYRPFTMFTPLQVQGRQGKEKRKKKKLRRQKKLSLHQLRKERHIGSMNRESPSPEDERGVNVDQ
eukprot:1148774-Pelagomonas_calceolata.AAC.2